MSFAGLGFAVARSFAEDACMHFFGHGSFSQRIGSHSIGMDKLEISVSDLRTRYRGLNSDELSTLIREWIVSTIEESLYKGLVGVHVSCDKRMDAVTYVRVLFVPKSN